MVYRPTLNKSPSGSSRSAFVLTLQWRWTACTVRTHDLHLRQLRKHSHPLTHQSDSLYNIVNGQVVSETEVNVQDAVAIGQDMRTSFAVSLPGGFHHPIKKTVKTMQVLKLGVKIKGKTVYDLEAVFARLVIVGRNRNVDLADVFQHELCSVPPSLIDEYGCIRKRSKAVLVSRL